MDTDRTVPPRELRLFGLVDAASAPDKIYPLLQKSGAGFRSVYAGLPEDEVGEASLFLVPVDDISADWVVALDKIDLQSPCLSFMLSRADTGSLARHLQAFLFADIGDNMTAMIRFFDPRNTHAVLGVWDAPTRRMFAGPISRWMCRGRDEGWRDVWDDSSGGACIREPVPIHLNQPAIDALMAHTEPDELLATLIDIGVVDGSVPYAKRFADFSPRYQRAQQWGLTEAADRLVFCSHSYRYGREFDDDSRVRNALMNHKGTALAVTFAQIPSSVWEGIEFMQQLRAAQI